MEAGAGGRGKKTPGNLPGVSSRKDRAAKVVGLSPKTLTKSPETPADLYTGRQSLQDRA